MIDCYIFSDLRFLFEIQAILPKTSPFLAAQMALPSIFFQMFKGLEMYNFDFFITALLEKRTMSNEMRKKLQIQLV